MRARRLSRAEQRVELRRARRRSRPREQLDDPALVLRGHRVERASPARASGGRSACAGPPATCARSTRPSATSSRVSPVRLPPVTISRRDSSLIVQPVAARASSCASKSKRGSVVPNALAQPARMSRSISVVHVSRRSHRRSAAWSACDARVSASSVVRACERHHVTSPPATGSACAGDRRASGRHSQPTARATSSGWISRRCGLRAASAARASASRLARALDDVRDRAAHDVGLDVAGAHRVHRHAVGAISSASARVRPIDAVLRRAVRGHVRVADEPAVLAMLTMRPAGASSIAGQHRARAQVDAGEVHGEHLVPQRRVGRARSARWPRARVVDEDRHGRWPARAIASNACADAALVAHVARLRVADRRAAERLHRCVRAARGRAR